MLSGQPGSRRPYARDAGVDWLAAAAAVLFIIFSVMRCPIGIVNSPAPREVKLTPPVPVKNVDGPAPEQTPRLQSNQCLLSIPTTSRNISHDENVSWIQRAPGESKRPHPNKDINSNHASEVATEFMPVGYCKSNMVDKSCALSCRAQLWRVLDCR